MSYFKRAADIIISTNLEFGNITVNSLQQFRCKNGEVAGWSIKFLGSLKISQVFNCSTGKPVLIGNVSVLPGIDLTGGYFSSGCIPDGDPMDQQTRYYKVDYDTDI